MAMLILSLISLIGLTYAFTLNEWQIETWYEDLDEDEDGDLAAQGEDETENSRVEYHGLRLVEVHDTDEDGTEISTRSNPSNEAEWICDLIDDGYYGDEDEWNDNAKDSLKVWKEDYCPWFKESNQIINYTTYGVYVSLAFGAIGLMLGAFVTKGLSTKYASISFLLSGLTAVASGIYYQQMMPAMSEMVLWEELGIVREFGIGLWIAIASGGLTTLSSIIGFFSDAHDDYW